MTKERKVLLANIIVVVIGAIVILICMKLDDVLTETNHGFIAGFFRLLGVVDIFATIFGAAYVEEQVRAKIEEEEWKEERRKDNEKKIIELEKRINQLEKKD